MDAKGATIYVKEFGEASKTNYSMQNYKKVSEYLEEERKKSKERLPRRIETLEFQLKRAEYIAMNR